MHAVKNKKDNICRHKHILFHPNGIILLLIIKFGSKMDIGKSFASTTDYLASSTPKGMTEFTKETKIKKAIDAIANTPKPVKRENSPSPIFYFW